MTEQSQPGRLVGGRYRLVDRLGAGGMGRVWRAHDHTLGIDVAVKEVSLPFMLSEQQLAERLSRAEREARNTVRLRDQPGIVTVYDVVIDDDAPWIVMQLVAGRSLDEHLREHGPLSVENTAKVADTMLRALAAAHAAGIVHRDVKPANVLLADDGRVLLTDFGIAQHEGDSSLTVTGAVIGSAEYLAPERARAEDAGPASDLFSLGVTLYQAVEGISPFRRDTPTATLTAVLFEQPKPPKNAGRLAPLLAALLAKEAGQRPSVPTALAMLGGGAGVGGAAPTMTASAGPSTPPIPQTRALTNPVNPAPAYAPAPPPSGNGNGNGNGLKIGLVVAAVVAVGALATLGVTTLMHSGTPSATSSSTKSTKGTTEASTTSSPTPAPTTSSSLPSPDGVKAGCTEATRDINAFDVSNPSASHDKSVEIAADRNLAAELTADANLATDPTVQTAIENLANAWSTFANDYQNGDTSGMSNTIPQTTADIGTLTTACNS